MKCLEHNVKPQVKQVNTLKKGSRYVQPLYHLRVQSPSGTACRSRTRLYYHPCQTHRRTQNQPPIVAWLGQGELPPKRRPQATHEVPARGGGDSADRGGLIRPCPWSAGIRATKGESDERGALGDCQGRWLRRTDGNARGSCRGRHRGRWVPSWQRTNGSSSPRVSANGRHTRLGDTRPREPQVAVGLEKRRMQSSRSAG